MSFNIRVKGPHDEKSRVAQPLIPADKIVRPKFEEYSLADKRRESFQTFPTMHMMITGETEGQRSALPQHIQWCLPERDIDDIVVLTWSVKLQNC